MIDQFALGLGAVCDLFGPGRHSAIPGQRVAANLNPVLATKIDDRIGFFEPEFIAGRAQLRPFQFTFRHDHLAIRDNCVAIGQIGHQRVGSRRGTVRNQHSRRRAMAATVSQMRTRRTGPLCRKCPMRQLAASTRKSRRECVFFDMRAPGLRCGNHKQTALQYPVQRRAAATRRWLPDATELT